MSFFTTTGTITTPQQSGTNYYFVTFNNNGTITFNSSVSPISYLVVGGGGGGGAGTFIPGIFNSFYSYGYSYSGGGGASGDILTGSFIPSINQPINILVGTGGSGGTFNNNIPSGGSMGGSSSINNIYSANGGNGGSPGIADTSVFSNTGTSYPLGGQNQQFGSGGSGVAENYAIADQPASINQIISQTNQTNATFNTSYQNYILNGYVLGNFGGGGGGGGSGIKYNDLDILPSNLAGGGGSGADSTNNATNGKNGGGGGGTNAFVNNIGGKGGDGIVILSFKETIVTNYKIPGGNDLKDIFFPLSSGGTTGSTGTGYNYYTGSGYQDLTNLFAQYQSGSPTAPQTFYTTAYYGGKDLNQVFQNINYPPYYTITASSNLTFTEYTNNGYIGLVFEVNNSSNNATATILFNIDLTNATIIVIGGGGSGGNDGGGGGGGGISLITGNTLYKNQSYNLSVGNGGPSPPNNLNSNGNTGANSSFDTYISYGGQRGISAYNGNNDPPNGGNGGSINTTNGGGGGGGAGGSGYGGSGGNGGIGGTNSNNANSGNNGNNYIDPSTSSYGGSSYYYTINLPFLQPSTSIIVGGGSGAGYEGLNGGLNGFGTSINKGGQSSANSGYTGESSISSISTGYGNGGGGSSYNATTGELGIGGQGGNGVVIIYWPV